MSLVAIIVFVLMAVVMFRVAIGGKRFYRDRTSLCSLMVFTGLLLLGDTIELVLFLRQGWPCWWTLIIAFFPLTFIFLLALAHYHLLGASGTKPDDREQTKQEILRLLRSHGPLDTSDLAVELMPNPDDDDGFLKLLDDLCSDHRIEIREPNDDPWLIVWGMPTLHFRKRMA